MINGNEVLNMLCSFLKSIVADNKPLGIYYRDIIVIPTYLVLIRQESDPVYENCSSPVERVRGVGIYNCEAGKLIPKDCSSEILRNMEIITPSITTFSSMHGGENITIEDTFYVIGVFWDDSLFNLGCIDFDDTTPVDSPTPVVRIIHTADNEKLSDKITRYTANKRITQCQST